MEHVIYVTVRDSIQAEILLSGKLDCFKTKNCQGSGNSVSFADDKSTCCAQSGQGSYYDHDTQTCQTCPGTVHITDTLIVLFVHIMCTGYILYT